MLKPISFLITSALTIPFLSQASDIYVAELTPNKKFVNVKPAVNITKRPGYDNQPMFNSTGSGLYYTSMLPQGDIEQTDTMYYSFLSKGTTNITNTPKFSEYSPTPIENDSYLSMIFVDETGSQKLWKTHIESGKQTPINLDIEPVGYHAWGKGNDLLLFVLGKRMMLQYAKQAEQKSAPVITKDIGRSLRYNSSKDIFTFSKGTKTQVLHSFDANTGKIQRLIPLPTGSDYYTWLNDSMIISAQGNQLMVWPYETSGNAQQINWLPLADLSASCTTQVTRLAVSKQVDKLAFVCEDK